MPRSRDLLEKKEQKRMPLGGGSRVGVRKLRYTKREGGTQWGERWGEGVIKKGENLGGQDFCDYRTG